MIKKENQECTNLISQEREGLKEKIYNHSY